MTVVPFLDLGRLHTSIRSDLEVAFARVLDSSAFVGGDEVSAFEDEFAAAHQVSGAAGCNSGTDALVLALRALGIGVGDEVIVPSMTFIATGEAVVQVGATPVIADVDGQTLLLSDDEVRAVRTNATRAVIAVHLYGHVVPFEALAGWRASGLVVIEDAAQSHLGRWRDSLVGTVSDAACFSFFPGKNLGALGDGGAVVSNDEALLDEVRRLRDHGRTAKYRHDVMGYSSRLDGLQAAFLRTKLRYLVEWTEARRAHADQYRHLIGDHLVPWEAGAVHHLLVARADATKRDAALDGLRAASIGCGVHYPLPLSQQPSMSAWSAACPEAERAAAEVLSLPIDPLMSAEDIETVCDSFTAVIG